VAQVSFLYYANIVGWVGHRWITKFETLFFPPENSLTQYDPSKHSIFCLIMSSLDRVAKTCLPLLVLLWSLASKSKDKLLDQDKATIEGNSSSLS